MKYTDEERLQYLEILRRNGYSYYKTYKETKISVNTLRSWNNTFRATSDKSTSLVSKIANKSAELDLSILDIVKRKQELCNKAIDILSGRLEKASEKKDINESMKIISNKDLIAAIRVLDNGNPGEEEGKKRTTIFEAYIRKIETIKIK